MTKHATIKQLHKFVLIPKCFKTLNDNNDKQKYNDKHKMTYISHFWEFLSSSGQTLTCSLGVWSEDKIQT